MTQNDITTWTLDPAHTSVEFSVKHMMFSKVRGRFDAVAGTIAMGSDGDVSDASVQVVIQSASIHTGQSQRDEHLRSADFFDVETFPELTYRSSSIRRVSDDRYTVVGDLTMHGVTREVELDVIEGGQGTDPWGNQRIAFSATATVDRRDFGLSWNQALETGGILVGNDITISLEVQATEAQV
jgi:polyisoprenoid-binding protein YceI